MRTEALETVAVSTRRRRSHPVRDLLRTATAEIHAELHEAEPFARIARGEIDWRGYGNLLCALHRFHSTLAPVCRVAAATMDIDSISAIQGREDRLIRDLAHLGINPITAPAVPPRDLDPRFAVGCWYTVQGSTLGGKVIDRQLRFLLPTVAGREFFASTPEDGALWNDFCERLETYAEDTEQQPAIVAGAQYAFEFFKQCLESGAA